MIRDPQSAIASLFASAILSLAILSTPGLASADDYAAIRSEVAKRHDESVKRLQDWIALPSISAEDLNYPVARK